MKILVTGRHGQLAESLEERSLGGDGVELHFAARPDVDLAVSGSLAAAIAKACPDLVINAAAYTNVDRAEEEPDLAFRLNADAAGEAAGAAADVGAAIIQLSTDYVFDGQLDRPYCEDDPVNPLNVYGASKAAGEERVRAANPRHLILRTSWVISPFGRNFVKTMVIAARDRDTLKVIDDQVGSPSSALDLADGLFALVRRWSAGTHGLGQTYHLAGSGSTSWNELARHVLAQCGRLGLPTAEVQPIRTEDWPTKAERPRNSVLDNGKFEREFEVRMPDWRASVDEIVKRLADRGQDD